MILVTEAAMISLSLFSSAVDETESRCPSILSATIPSSVSVCEIVMSASDSESSRVLPAIFKQLARLGILRPLQLDTLRALRNLVEELLDHFPARLPRRSLSVDETVAFEVIEAHLLCIEIHPLQLLVHSLLVEFARAGVGDTVLRCDALGSEIGVLLNDIEQTLALPRCWPA